MTSQKECSYSQTGVPIAKKVYLYPFPFFKVIYFYHNFSDKMPP